MLSLLKNRTAWILGLASFGIAIHLLLRFTFPVDPSVRLIPLWLVIGLGGLPLVFEILMDLFKGEMGADVLAAIAIITAAILKEYLAAAIIVLMLSGGDLLEEYAVHNASSVLKALLKRMPKIAHRKNNTTLTDIALDQIAIDDILAIFPHEIVPVDGVVIEGQGVMDESFLTGEPFQMSKTPGSEVYSGAINGNQALTIRATKMAIDSRYAQITAVMRAAEDKKPRLRRLADQLGTIYTPISLLVAGAAWWWSGLPDRFLSVLVIATPCPLIIAIPVAIIGAISLCAKRGIIVKNPIALEQIEQCQTAIYDKTGTLTYGQPELVDQEVVDGVVASTLLVQVASLERYSKHPLSRAIQAASHLKSFENVSEVHEKPGEGLSGKVGDHSVEVVGRKQVIARKALSESMVQAHSGGLECFIFVDGKYAARYRFRDTPRSDSAEFVRHLGPHHAFNRQIIVSGTIS